VCSTELKKKKSRRKIMSNLPPADAALTISEAHLTDFDWKLQVRMSLLDVLRSR